MWQTINNQLYKKFTFEDFNEAFGFLQRVGEVAQRRNHHPKIHNNWNIVELWLSTHSAGDVVTEKDTEMAEEIDSLMGLRPHVDTSMATIKKVKLYADGGSRGNPGPSASGYVLLNDKDEVIKKSGVYLGITTNNQAEYLALKFGLEEAQKMGIREVDVYMDSLLVVNQMKGIFKVKNRDLWPIHEAIKEQVKLFKKVTFTHVPREFNKLADAEVNTTLDAEKS